MPFDFLGLHTFVLWKMCILNVGFDLSDGPDKSKVGVARREALKKEVHK